MSIELPGIFRHHRDVNERLLKAAVNRYKAKINFRTFLFLRLKSVRSKFNVIPTDPFLIITIIIIIIIITREPMVLYLTCNIMVKYLKNETYIYGNRYVQLKKNK